MKGIVMGDLTKNVSRHELRCRCGKCDSQTMDWETLTVVQRACSHFEKVLGVSKVTLLINSAHRCPTHNKNVGGASKSKHVNGTAMDIRIKGVTPKELFDYFDKEYPNKYGIGLYKNFTHIDSRKERARW